MYSTDFKIEKQEIDTLHLFQNRFSKEIKRCKDHNNRKNSIDLYHIKQNGNNSLQITFIESKIFNDIDYHNTKPLLVDNYFLKHSKIFNIYNEFEYQKDYYKNLYPNYNLDFRLVFAPSIKKDNDNITTYIYNLPLNKDDFYKNLTNISGFYGSDKQYKTKMAKDKIIEVKGIYFSREKYNYKFE